MLNLSTTQIGTNLALILHDRKIDLTPKAATLVEALSKPVKNRIDTLGNGWTTEALPHILVESSQGDRSVVQGSPNSVYNPTEHDTLMDNYIVELSQIIGQHVNFARQVVHTKVKHLQDATEAAFSRFQIKEAEDFFVVHYYEHPELFKSDFIAQEVLSVKTPPKSAMIVNFGDALSGEFDLSAYFVTGDEVTDELIQKWISKTGKDKLMSYLTPKSAGYELTLFGPNAIDFYMTNFLLYRQLAIKQDISVGMSERQLITAASTNRDYYAGQLANQLENYERAVNQGVLLTPDSETKFSYLSGRKFEITIYEDAFKALVDEDRAMEKIYGAIASTGSTSLTVEMVKGQGPTLLAKWNSVRSLYSAYLVSSRSNLLKSSLKLALDSAIDLECGEGEDCPIKDTTYRAQSVELALAYIDTLQSSDADDLYKVCMEVMARIVYRFSNAYFFIREMYEILEHDDDIDPRDAAHAACVSYITDFLLEQVDIGKTQAV